MSIIKNQIIDQKISSSIQTEGNTKKNITKTETQNSSTHPKGKGPHFWGQSSYDRYLDIVLWIWPKIKEQLPDATLDICYGWDLFLKAYANNPERMKWKDKLDELMKQPGITHHGRIGQDKMRKLRKKMDIWIYPTYFCVTGDTLVDMPRNYLKYPSGVPIKELVGKKPIIWTFNEKSGIFELKQVNWVKKTQNKAEVIKINWDDGTSLKCTPDHKILTYKRGWVKAKDLDVGESAVAFKKHFAIQISAGKGSWPLEHREIALTKFGNIPKGYHVDHIDGNPFNNEIDNLQLLSPEEHAKKTFTGVVQKIQSVKKRMVGWKSWANSEVGKKKISENGSTRSSNFWNSMTEEERKIFVKNRQEKTKEKYSNWWNGLSEEVKRNWGKKGRETRWNHKVLSIEKYKNEDVYDMSVKDNHNFIAGGVVIHNCETNCIGALECQRDGVVPCTMDLAGLKDTVGSGIKIDGDIYKPEVRIKFIDEIVKLAKDKKRLEEERKKGKEFIKKFSWPNIADQWVKEFQ